MLNTLIVIDFETTGLDPRQSCPWEIGAAAVHGCEIVSTFAMRMRPELEFFTSAHRENVKKQCGLSDASLLSLLDQPTKWSVRNLFCDWALEVSGELAFHLAAFNAPFDRSFFEWGIWNEYSNPGRIPTTWAPCIMERCAQVMGRPTRADGTRRVSLENACRHFVIRQAGAHDALSDAVSAAQLWIELEKRAGC